MEIIKYVGFINGPIFIFVCLYLISGLKKFDLAKNPICKLGAIKSTSLYFNIALIAYSIGQILIVFQIIRAFDEQFITFALSILIVSSVTGLLAGVITMRRNIVIHNWLARSAFFLTIVGGFCYGISLLQVNFGLASLNVISAVLLGSILLFNLKKGDVEAKAEFVFFLCLTAWDMVNIWYILRM